MRVLVVEIVRESFYQKNNRCANTEMSVNKTTKRQVSIRAKTLSVFWRQNCATTLPVPSENTSFQKP